MLTENSQFDNNEDGFDTNSQSGDNPPPQNGAGPAVRGWAGGRFRVIGEPF